MAAKFRPLTEDERERNFIRDQSEQPRHFFIKGLLEKGLDATYARGKADQLMTYLEPTLNLALIEGIKKIQYYSELRNNPDGFLSWFYTLRLQDELIEAGFQPRHLGEWVNVNTGITINVVGVEKIEGVKSFGYDGQVAVCANGDRGWRLDYLHGCFTRSGLSEPYQGYMHNVLKAEFKKHDNFPPLEFPIMDWDGLNYGGG